MKLITIEAQLQRPVEIVKPIMIEAQPQRSVEIVKLIIFSFAFDTAEGDNLRSMGLDWYWFVKQNFIKTSPSEIVKYRTS